MNLKGEKEQQTGEEGEKAHLEFSNNLTFGWGWGGDNVIFPVPPLEHENISQSSCLLRNVKRFSIKWHWEETIF